MLKFVKWWMRGYTKDVEWITLSRYVLKSISILYFHYIHSCSQACMPAMVSSKATATVRKFSIGKIAVGRMV